MPVARIGETVLNQYRIEAFIARTPLGELYRVVETRSDRSYAFTLLPKTISENIEALKELEAEWPNLRGISGPNLIPYLGIFQTPTLAFVLEDWVDGPTLKDILERGPVHVEESLIHLKALCSALETLHQRGYLHLNLAPELIHINKQGE